MYSKKSIKKWVAPVSLASLLVSSQLPASLVAHAEESTQVTTTNDTNVVGKDVSYKNALKNSSAFLLSITPNPNLGDEYVVTNLARSNYPVAKDYYAQYYNNIVKNTKEKNGNIGKSYSDYANIIIALSSIGKDPTNVAGVNLVDKMLDSYNETKADYRTFTQTSTILLALDANNYTIDQEKYKNLNRDSIIDELLTAQTKDNGYGWAVGADADPDTTAMVVTALAPYMNQDKVSISVNKALSYLQKQLNGKAGIYSDWLKGDNAASISQVVMSLLALKIDPKTEAGFVKTDGYWTIQNLLTAVDSKTGGLKMSSNQKAVDPSYATPQGNRALTMYDRFEQKEKVSPFYNMSEVKAENLAYDTKAPEKPSVKTVADNTTTITGKTESYATVTVKNGSKVIGTAKADFKGAYSIKIKKQKAGTTLKIVATDLGKNNSKTVSVKVVDKTAPKVPTINKVTKNSTKVVGTAEAKATVYIVKDKKVIKTGKVSTKGKYSLSIKKQKVGTKLTVYVKDAAKNKSASKTITVKSK
ncbi:Ig-like domain-containing protein [Rummeliibacillus pycnus]|uniref:Ig-like domain-containing protein n=1 Tax=Rummeliibacillus pycnus TaxID=101070 RepID=UPI003D284CFB